jgi:hypothetical protein
MDPPTGTALVVVKPIVYVTPVAAAWLFETATEPGTTELGGIAVLVRVKDVEAGPLIAFTVAVAWKEPLVESAVRADDVASPLPSVSTKHSEGGGAGLVGLAGHGAKVPLGPVAGTAYSTVVPPTGLP